MGTFELPASVGTVAVWIIISVLSKPSTTTIVALPENSMSVCGTTTTMKPNGSKRASLRSSTSSSLCACSSSVIEGMKRVRFPYVATAFTSTNATI